MEKKKYKYPNLMAEMGRYGITQTSLGKYLGLAQEVVSNRLAGKSKWSLEEVEKLCEYFEKDYNYLFK